MAIQISYADHFGTTHGSSYVRIRAVQVLTTSSGVSHAIVDWEMFVSAAARSKSDTDSMKSVIMSGSYLVDGSDFTTYFADSVLDDTNKSPMKQAYAWLKTKNDATDNSGYGINWTTGTTDV